jgi:hypothetical protein
MARLVTMSLEGGRSGRRARRDPEMLMVIRDIAVPDLGAIQKVGLCGPHFLLLKNVSIQELKK